mgnify:CR=1 FL=1
MTTLLSFNPRILYHKNIDQITSQEYKLQITDTLSNLYIDSPYAKILLNKLIFFNDRIIFMNKDPSPYISITTIYPKIIYPTRNHGFGDVLIIVLPPFYEGSIHSINPLKNEGERNKVLIDKIYKNIPLRKPIDNDTFEKFKIIKKKVHFKIYLVHELLHAYHYLYNTPFENKKEELEPAIIYGLEKYPINHENKKIYITENRIRSDLGLYPRISYN